MIQNIIRKQQKAKHLKKNIVAWEELALEGIAFRSWQELIAKKMQRRKHWVKPWNKMLDYDFRL